MKHSSKGGSTREPSVWFRPLARLRLRPTRHVSARGQSHPHRHTGEACPWQGTGGQFLWRK